jgi:hypothetical protein
VVSRSSRLLVGLMVNYQAFQLVWRAGKGDILHLGLDMALSPCFARLSFWLCGVYYFGFFCFCFCFFGAFFGFGLSRVVAESCT